MKRTMKIAAMALFLVMATGAMPAEAATRRSPQRQVSALFFDFLDRVSARVADETRSLFPALDLLRETRRIATPRARGEGLERRVPQGPTRIGREREQSRPRFRFATDIP